jgi:hypothetical protein
MVPSLTIVTIIILTSIIQSLVGVGVLLFGTPLLLLLGFNYFEVLNILLPISITINLIQLGNNLGSIDTKLSYNLATLILPIIALSLTFATFIQISFTKIIGIFLLFISISNFFNFNIKSIVNGKIYLFIMAVIHGLTNLGGSLLTGYVSMKEWDKLKTRTNIAFCYLSFATTQLITLKINDLVIFSENTLTYIAIGISTYFLANKYLFSKVGERRFSKIIPILLFIFGCMLLLIKI